MCNFGILQNLIISSASGICLRKYCTSHCFCQVLCEGDESCTLLAHQQHRRGQYVKHTVPAAAHSFPAFIAFIVVRGSFNKTFTAENRRLSTMSRLSTHQQMLSGECKNLGLHNAA